MRRMRYGIFAALMLVTGCGSTKTFANKPRPASPVNLTVYISDHRVSVSPASVGAGEVVFIVTNQARQAISLTVHSAQDPAQPLADTGPINPQSTSEVTVDFSQPGRYQLAADGGAPGAGPSIAPAPLRIGAARSSSSGDLMLP